jgi:PAS domain S-box-containing protein
VATLQALCQHHPESFLLLDEQGIVLEASQVAAHRLGRSRDELLGTSIFVHFPPAVSRFRRDLVNQVKATGQARRVEERRDPFWFDTQVIPLAAGAGAVAKLMVLAVDITARKRAEQALRESEERFRLLIENSLVGVFLIQDGKFRYVNPVLAQTFGHRQADFCGRLSPMRLVHPKDRPRLASEIKRRFAGELPEGASRFTGLRRDGASIECEVLSLRGEYQGRPAIMGTLLDVTARQETQEALQTQARVLEHMAEAVQVADEAGTIIFANPASHAMFGYPEGALIGRHVSQLNALPPEDNARFVRRLIAHLQQEGRWSGEVRNRKRDGTPFFTQARISALEVSGKTSWISVQEDITAFKRATQTLAMQAQLLDMALDGIIAHDLAGKVIYVNQEAARQRGYRAAEMLGRQITDFIAPGSPREESRARLEIMQDPETVYEFKSTHLRRDGSTFPVEVRGRLIQIDGNPLYLGVARDISERQRFEASLRHSEARLRTLFESAQDVIFMKDRESR